ncbi:hypothetical protein ACR6HW_12575 [Fusibacter sp. JL298sf-3]
MSNLNEQEKAFHKKYAVAYNNATWDFIDNQERTAAETLEMIHMAHTSRFLWGKVGDAKNLERGEWLVSRAYAEAGIGDRALFHAQQCLDICLEHDIADFDIAFAYEGLTRAHKCLGDQEAYNRCKANALEAAEHIAGAEDKKYFLDELQKL